MANFTTGHVFYQHYFCLSINLFFGVKVLCLLANNEWFILLLHWAVPKTSGIFENGEIEDEDGGVGKDGVDKSIIKLTKAERRAKLKKGKKDAKKQGKDLSQTEQVQQTPQAAILVLCDCNPFMNM